MLYLPLIRVYVSQVRARLKNLPALGVPCRADGSYDPVVSEGPELEVFHVDEIDSSDL